MNWFNRYKQADSGGGGGGGQTGEGSDDFHPYEGTPFMGEDEEQTNFNKVDYYDDTALEGYNPNEVSHLERKPAKSTKGSPSIQRDPETGITYQGEAIQLPFQEGDRVRDRHRGNAVEQRYGKIVGIGDNKFKIRWEDSDQIEEIGLNDPVTISKKLSRV